MLRAAIIKIVSALILAGGTFFGVYQTVHAEHKELEDHCRRNDATLIANHCVRNASVVP